MGSKQKKLSTRELCYIGIFTAIVAVGAQIHIPQPGGIPFTLQAWAIGLAGLVLGPKCGAIVAIIYALLGAVGAPVFHAFQGGMGIIVGRTGGFVLSFPLLALLAGLGERKEGIAWSFLGLALGNFVNLASGMLYFSWVTSLSIPASFGYSVAPFIAVTIVMIAVLPFLSKSIKFAMNKAKITI